VELIGNRVLQLTVCLFRVLGAIRKQGTIFNCPTVQGPVELLGNRVQYLTVRLFRVMWSYQETGYFS